MKLDRKQIGRHDYLMHVLEKVETAKQYTKLGPLWQARKMGVKADIIESE